MRFTSLPRAFVRETSEIIPQNYSLDNFIRKSLRRLNVSFFDKCCGVAAINATATATPDNIYKGVITSTSVAATTITLPTGSNLGAFLGAVQGSKIDFLIDNFVGASVVTVALAVGITVVSPIVITGGGTLTVAAGSVGQFRLIFIDKDSAILARIV